jgi:hypothetical protein
MGAVDSAEADFTAEAEEADTDKNAGTRIPKIALGREI